MSARLWDGSVPNTPIGPPPRQTNKRPPPNWTYTGPVSPATQAKRSRQEQKEQTREED